MNEKRTSISRKLFAAMAIPVLFVALIAGSRVVEARNQRNVVRHQTELALSTGGPGTLVNAIQNERNISGIEMLGVESIVKLDSVTDSKSARIKVDAAMKDFKNYLAGSGSEVREIYSPSYDVATRELVKVRAIVDSPKNKPSPTDQAQANLASGVYDRYSVIVNEFITANRKTISRIDDATLRNRATAISNLTVTSDLLSQVSRIAATSVLTDSSTGQIQDAVRLYDRFDQARREAQVMLNGDDAHQKIVDAYYSKKSFSIVDHKMQEYLGSGHLEMTDVQVLMLNAGSVSKPDVIDAWTAARDSMQIRADSLVSAASTKLWWNVALFFLSAGISILVAYLIARTISKPLVHLAGQANVMASKLLPEAVHNVLATPIGRDIYEPKLSPITVTSHDEVADVAVALTDVQDRALSLAVEQAALRHNFADAFVNLGRRMQGLIMRQLEFITDLEDTETDDENLSNLFKLDHIATRIRRNAESLIVLGGNEQRSTGRIPPMEAIDTVRAALSEVEDYQRIDLGDFDETRLPGDVATDLSHIIAELMENGLMFSPPDCEVEVSGQLDNAGYMFTIADRGIGMDEDAIEKSNLRLAAEESFSVAPSRYLGHYIAGHLAKRVGVQIKLKARPGGGTVAGVFVPNKLFVTKKPQEAEIEQ